MPLPGGALGLFLGVRSIRFNTASVPRIGEAGARVGIRLQLGCGPWRAVIENEDDAIHFSL